MPFLRFSRDKRGYEHTYLVQATNRRGKPIRPRILYWYRTPPGVRLGRLAFDDEVRKTLEAENPGITFDWPAIVSTPFPAQEPEYWRERRRAERAAKQARRQEESDDEPADPDLSGEAFNGEPAAADTGAGVVPEVEPAVDALLLEGPVPPAETPAADGAAPGPQTRKRRRRGGRRRRGRAEGAPDALTSPAAAGGDPADTSESPESASEDLE